ncbi:MAG: aminotransferase class III-fold pyridoxal phosphate-dependent enzyme [Candidatus Aminicenantales bacterium]|jgi:glutamate-1-semialdehyde 2,1-aminomutase
MKKINKLLDVLETRYKKKTKKSRKLHERAQAVMVRGGSHSIRLWTPYPFFMARAKGPYVYDVDGNAFIDYWQGHYANILGHNPAVLKKEFERFDPEAGSLHTGFEGESQVLLAELLLKQIGHKDYKVRFTTSGTLATMYAVMLAQATTGRQGILKIGGGWHGASPYLLKGVKFHEKRGFNHPESAGVPREILRDIFITRFDDPDDLERILQKKRDKIGCFILEPFLGVGGFLAASKEYIELARRLTERYGIVLIFDEIVSGFRFCPSGVQKLYGVEPDLSTFGKVIGGGHAVSAVAGRTEILDVKPSKASGYLRVQFEGGTFSSHPQYMRAGYVMLKHLVEHAAMIYPRLVASGDLLRKSVEDVFLCEGIEARCTGYGNEVIRGGSLYMVNFPLKKTTYSSAEDLWNPRFSDVRLKEEILKIALLTENVHVVHGGGAISLAHEDTHITKTVEAYAETAKLFKKYLY